MVTYNGAYYGISDDQKPTDALNGACFIEMNTGKIYFYDADNATWREWGA